ncbi:uncharacterized protein LOC135485536 [Lineus longissimus]|uniref:uncharacterized protein LOC135485536 n=1 Tax=Lineus longissimus TaxID=88925 RepID=UPI002B4EFEA9
MDDIKTARPAADQTPRPKGAMALWYRTPDIEKKVNYPSTLSLERKVNLARAKVERYREENRMMPEMADDLLWLKITNEEREKAKANYAKRHMMRSAIKDYAIADYEEHRVFNEVLKRQEEIDKEKRKGESDADCLRRIEREEENQTIQVLKKDWETNSQHEDPLIKEARGKVAKFRSSNPTMNEVPDEIIWERIEEQAREEELTALMNTPEARSIEDILADHERERVRQEVGRRRAEIFKVKKRYEGPEDALLRLERLEKEKIRLALRADWNERDDKC